MSDDVATSVPAPPEAAEPSVAARRRRARSGRRPAGRIGAYNLASRRIALEPDAQ